MPAFRVSGSTGQAPTTMYLCPLAQGAVAPSPGLNMLAPWHYNFGIGGFTLDQWINDSQIKADFVNQWTILDTTFNIGGASALTCGLGALTTAPDGTNTGQKIIETTTNSPHMLMAGNQAGDSTFSTRLAVFAKAAERTRIVLAIGNRRSAVGSGSTAAQGNGSRTVFDLANGVIAVANTATTGATHEAIAGQAGIIPYGNGWYLCYMDTQGAAGITASDTNWDTNSAWVGYFYLDTGSGSAAENSTYTGSAGSGVYAWRSNMLPSRAWAMSGARTFFDDFTSLSTIDLANTQAPGFNWYLNQTWAIVPNWTNQLACRASYFSQSGSVLTFSPTAAGGGIDTIWGGCTPTGPGTFRGTVYQPPGLFEWNISYDNSIFTPTGTVAFWTTNIEGLMNGNVNPYGSSGGGGASAAFPYNYHFLETDWFEAYGGGLRGLTPATSMLPGVVGSSGNYAAEIQVLYPINSFTAWKAATTYNTNDRVNSAGVFYISLAGSNLNNPPASSPGSWAVWPGSVSPVTPVSPSAIISDNFNTYSMLWLPALKNDIGQMLIFFNGRFISIGGYGFGGDISTGDGLHYPLLIDSGEFFPMKIDWVAVTQ